MAIEVYPLVLSQCRRPAQRKRRATGKVKGLTTFFALAPQRRTCEIAASQPRIFAWCVCILGSFFGYQPVTGSVVSFQRPRLNLQNRRTQKMGGFCEGMSFESMEEARSRLDAHMLRIGDIHKNISVHRCWCSRLVALEGLLAIVPDRA